MFHEVSFQIINIYSICCQTGLQGYYDTRYSRDGVNRMWILTNSKAMLEYIRSRYLCLCNSI